MKTVRLSRRNLLTLLSKLDRVKAGEVSACTLIKTDQDITLKAFEDDVYYEDREPGEVHPKDTPR